MKINVGNLLKSAARLAKDNPEIALAVVAPVAAVVAKNLPAPVRAAATAAIVKAVVKG